MPPEGRERIGSRSAPGRHERCTDRDRHHHRGGGDDRGGVNCAEAADGVGQKLGDRRRASLRSLLRSHERSESHETRSGEPHEGRRPEPYARSAPVTLRSTASYMAEVTVPVLVFCREG